MPVTRTRISINQLAELLGFDPRTFVGLDVDRPQQQVVILTEDVPIRSANSVARDVMNSEQQDTPEQGVI